MIHLNSLSNYNYSKMVKKNYSITLEKEVVDESIKNLEVGQKLSPVINDLLIKWNLEKKKNE